MNGNRIPLYQPDNKEYDYSDYSKEEIAELIRQDNEDEQ
jgi:hypothetical protein